MDMRASPSAAKTALCRVVADALDRNQRPGSDICIAKCKPICAYELRTHRGVPDGWTGRMYAVSAEVAVADEPPPGAEPLAILELQHCSSLVPTVHDWVPKHRYRMNSGIYTQMCAGPPDILRDSRLGGRLLDPEKVSTQLLCSWIKICEKEDGQTCGSVNAKNHDMTGRILVIDVERLCVVDAPWECRYVALSYCWGDTPTLKHTLANSTELRTPGGLDNELVPLTIRDAMLLIRHLGYWYLWVDALCIVQDDPISARQQVNRMDQIYSTAHFHYHRSRGQKLKCGAPRVIDGPTGYGRLSNSRWATRAWTMQERVLSPRKLIFTETQVFWECQEGIFLEEMVLEGALNQQFLIEPTASTSHDLGTGRNLDRLSKSALRSNYSALVQAYTGRQLTYRSDALNAFAGILNAMGRAPPAAGPRAIDSMVVASWAEPTWPAERRLVDSAVEFWGLPVENFNRALSWEWESSSRDGATCTAYSTTGTPQTLAFPSWSWTAWIADGGSCGKIKWFEDVYARHLVMPEVSLYSEGIDGELRFLVEPELDPISVGQFYVGGSHDRRDRWKGRFRTSNIIPTAKYDADFVSNGRLHFETSVATLRIYRLDSPSDSSPSEKAPSAFDAGPLDPGHQFKGVVRIRMNNSNALSWQDADHSAFWPKKRVVKQPQEDLTDLDRFRLATASIPVLQQILDRADLRGNAHAPVFNWNSESADIEGPGARHVLEADFIVIGRSVKDPKQYLRMLIVNWSEGVAYRIGCAWISEDDWGDLSNRKRNDQYGISEAERSKLGVELIRSVRALYGIVAVHKDVRGPNALRCGESRWVMLMDFERCPE
ncbi:hypothetical protein GP486_002602 [Trichoglossum hirsutum]|uniref:Heterokaryon incompatibility domain-containing protein n=1 Tax=Trichoglossum hirsutum TaxID=265104 RepID=A0A9P8LER7_9PEZI|nr:hypothetical protein GP486_002602 [Trichoglossum hirsutum]